MKKVYSFLVIAISLVSVPSIYPGSAHALLLRTAVDSTFVVVDDDNNLQWADVLRFEDRNYSEVQEEIDTMNLESFAGAADWHLASFAEIEELFDELVTVGDARQFDPTAPGANNWVHGRYEQSNLAGTHAGALWAYDSSLPNDSTVFHEKLTFSVNYLDTLATIGVGAFVVSSLPAPIPEPSTLLLIGTGLVGLVGLRKRHLLIVLVLTGCLAFNMGVANALVVVPNDLATVEGNGANSIPFDLGILTDPPVRSARYQQIYDASAFGGVSGFVTEIAFRPDEGPFGNHFAAILPDVQIDLSSTSAEVDALSTVFAANVGADNTTVFGRGSLSLSSFDIGPEGGPKAFDIIIPLETAFFYDPSSGLNLLLDVRIFDNGGVITTFFDSHTLEADAISRASTFTGGSVNDSNALFADTEGLVTQFSITPVSEPATLLLLATGLLGLVGFRKKFGM